MAKDCPSKQKKQKTDAASFFPTPLPSTSSSPSSSNRLCYVCRSPDHVSSLCPHKDVPPPRSSSSRGAPSSSRSTLRACFRCSSTSHSTVDCPEPKPCHLCHSTSHLASACPSKRQILHAKTLATPKPCHLCASLTHIARACPTLPHRRLYRDESKPRTLSCYVCHSDTHHAVECPQVDRLQGRFERVGVEGVGGVGSDECNAMLAMCGQVLEYRGAVWLVERMRVGGLGVTEQGWAGLLRLHEVSGKDQSRVEVEGVGTVKRARAEVARLVKGRRVGERVATAEERMGEVEEWVKQRVVVVGGRGGGEGEGGGVLGKNVFGLCKLMREGLGWSAKECREMAMAMIHLGRLSVGKQGVEWVGEGGAAGRSEARAATQVKGRGKREVKGSSEVGLALVAPTEATAVSEVERLRKAKRAKEKRRKQLKRARVLDQSTATERPSERSKAVSRRVDDD